MEELVSIHGITFVENGDVDVGQLNELYRVIGLLCQEETCVELPAHSFVDIKPGEYSLRFRGDASKPKFRVEILP